MAKHRPDVPAATDARMARRLSERDPQALEEVCALHGGKLYAFAFRLTGSREL